MRTIVNESKRGCGYRKGGGLYLVSGKLSDPCGSLPMRLDVCPCCGAGVKHCRGWTWIEPRKLFADILACRGSACMNCPAGFPPEGKHGLLWIGRAHYKTPAEFLAEAGAKGVSRRIKAVPRGFEVGKHWVYIAHVDAWSGACPDCGGDSDLGLGPALTKVAADVRASCERCKGTGNVREPGVFSIFKPTAVEYIVKGDETAEDLEKLEKRGLSLVKLERTDGLDVHGNKGGDV